MGKRGFYNIFWGLVGQFITICLGIVVPRLVLVSFGSEVNGLLNSISQVFAYFTLIEAGVGQTTLQALYKPTAEKDKDGVNAILSATSRYYKKIAIAYFVCVLLFAGIYPCTIQSELPFSWVFLIICLNGMGSVINFWIQGKYILFLNSIGKSYINGILNTIVNVLTSVSKIILLLNGCDVLRLQIVYFAISILRMAYIYIYIKIKYSWIDVNVKPNYAALSQRNSVLIHQISYLIFSNTDVILITYCLGLKYVSVYSMYLMLFSMLNNICTQVYTGFSFRLGQLYNTAKEYYIKIHDVFEVYYLALVFFVYSMALCFILPFLKLYTAGVNDINYIDFKLAILFFIMNLLSNGRNSSIMVINFAGHFKNTVKQTIIESVINLSVSIISISVFGIYGVLMGTIAALLYRMIDMIFYSNRILMDRSPWVTFRRWSLNFATALVVIAVFMNCKINIANYGELFLTAAITGVAMGSIFFIINSVFEFSSFKLVLKKVMR